MTNTCCRHPQLVSTMRSPLIRISLVLWDVVVEQHKCLFVLSFFTSGMQGHDHCASIYFNRVSPGKCGKYDVNVIREIIASAVPISFYVWSSSCLLRYRTLNERLRWENKGMNFKFEYYKWNWIRQWTTIYAICLQDPLYQREELTSHSPSPNVTALDSRKSWIWNENWQLLVLDLFHKPDKPTNRQSFIETQPTKKELNLTAWDSRTVLLLAYPSSSIGDTTPAAVAADEGAVPSQSPPLL